MAQIGILSTNCALLQAHYIISAMAYMCLHRLYSRVAVSLSACIINSAHSQLVMTTLAVPAGQVMLVWPHQMYRTGITAGCILMVASGYFNIWSMWILVIFYMERKNKMVCTAAPTFPAGLLVLMTSCITYAHAITSGDLRVIAVTCLHQHSYNTAQPIWACIVPEVSCQSSTNAGTALQ